MKKKLKILLETPTNLFEDLAKRYKKDADKIKTHREYFWRKYPEIFNDSSKNEVDEGKTRPKKPNLAEIRKRVCAIERQKRSQIIVV